MLKQPAVIGLDTTELRERLQGLADAVGCERSKAVRLACHTSSLIMMHPEYIKVGLVAAHTMQCVQNVSITVGALQLGCQQSKALQPHVTHPSGAR